MAAFAALALAIVCTAALVKYVRGAEHRALAGEELVDVLVAKDDVKAGTAGAELAAHVTAERVPAKVRADTAVTSFAQIEGLVTSVDIVKGEELLTSRFINPASFQGARSASVQIPDGANEVSFRKDLIPERFTDALTSIGTELFRLLNDDRGGK